MPLSVGIDSELDLKFSKRVSDNLEWRTHPTLENVRGPKTMTGDIEVNINDARDNLEKNSRLVTDSIVDYAKLGARPKVLSRNTQNASKGVDQITTSFSMLKSSFEQASKSRSDVASIKIETQNIDCNVGKAGLQSENKPKLQTTRRGSRIGRLRRIFEPSCTTSPLRENHDLDSIENLCLTSSAGKRKRKEVEEEIRVGKRTKGVNSSFSQQGAEQSDYK